MAKKLIKLQIFSPLVHAVKPGEATQNIPVNGFIWVETTAHLDKIKVSYSVCEEEKAVKVAEEKK